MRRVFIILFALFLASAVVAVGTVFFLFNTPVTTEERPVVFEVTPGSLAQTAKRLADAGLIRNAYHFRILARVKGGASVRVGEYQLSANMTPAKILEEISTGKSIQRTVTIPEGQNIFEVGAILEGVGIGTAAEAFKLCFDQAFLSKHLGFSVPSCEGYVFPETYSYTKYTKLEEMIAQMLSRFREQFKTIEGQGDQFGLNRHQVVTLASIIEKETGADEERELVSSVYHNRLRIKMRLQADPTTLYGKMMSSGKLENNITREDLKTVNEYNTYAISGLPKGPIANPGMQSLQAAVRPAQTDYLYFVSQNDGRHIFSKDFKTHNTAVESFQKKATARVGKSWRDLKKKKPRRK